MKSFIPNNLHTSWYHFWGIVQTTGREFSISYCRTPSQMPIIQQSVLWIALNRMVIIFGDVHLYYFQLDNLSNK